MTNRIDRRAFLRTSAAIGAGIAVGAAGCSSVPGAGKSVSSTPSAEKLGWDIGIQLYTFRHLPFYEALEPIKALGFRHVEPCNFLSLDKARPELKTGETLPAEVRKELKGRLDERGIRMTNFYSDLGGDPDKNRKIFEFAKEMGVRNIVAEPPPEAFDGIEKLCEEFAVNVAIHHHPKPDSRYWDPDTILQVCKGRGRRIGACCDTGHWVRSGLDPVACLKKMEGRVITLHLKDVIEMGNPAARDVPLGMGKANYRAVLEEVRRQGFKGCASIEYEHQSEMLIAEVGQSVDFVEKTARELGG